MIKRDNCGCDVVGINLTSDTKELTRYLGYCPIYGYFFVSGNMNQEWSMGQSNYFDLRSFSSKELIMQVLRGQMIEAISNFFTGCYISDSEDYLQDHTGGY